MTEKVLNDLAAKAKSFCVQNNQFETTYSSTFQINGFKQKEIGEQLDEEVCYCKKYVFEKIEKY